ncbi:MAG: aminomethyl-transferring glycine dehydrogenase subunit GcvPB [Candidatus Omnitrophica bacterium]|nr:aminomethyl-transferring glycine dehydrogenase subunit GcvPB [Candidatus Omnitrophota bacterium]
MLISKDTRLSFEKSRPGRRGAKLPKDRLSKYSTSSILPEELKRKRPLVFPELTEPEIIRHFVNLSKKNFSIDTHFYPLGSCTMKYNPKINEWAAALENFATVHPLQPADTAQGFLRIFYELEQYLKQMTGMDRFTLQPAAGAHGELTGMMLVHAYHERRGEIKRRKVLVPDSSHGTNPASAALLGYHVVELKSNARGRVDIETLEKHLDDETACLMLTNPNTLGLFEEEILEITKRVHQKGALLYYDGANMNALLGVARPGDMGFDIVHLNLHKTFSTPHGGGGPGAGPVGVKKELISYLPLPLVEKKGETYFWLERSEQSIGRVKSFHGNTGMLLRAYVYIRTLGLSGLKQVSEDAILNANYLKEKLKNVFPVAIDEPCMHEFVLSLKNGRMHGVHAGDVGKRLLDYGYHAPTVHFPLVVEEALMIEPTETESRETLDQFIEAMKQIAQEIESDPEKVKSAPHTLPIRRPDEVLAARKPILSYRDQMREKILQAEGVQS